MSDVAQDIRCRQDVRYRQDVRSPHDMIMYTILNCYPDVLSYDENIPKTETRLITLVLHYACVYLVTITLSQNSKMKTWLPTHLSVSLCGFSDRKLGLSELVLI
jgi:hypothetical protein